MTFACTTTQTTERAQGTPAESPQDAPSDSSQGDSSVPPAADAGSHDAASADAGLKPELVVLSNSDSPDESCDTFCGSRKTTCAPSCQLPSGQAGAGYITDVIDLDGHTQTTEYASCSDKVVSASSSVQTQSKCCCLSAPAQAVTNDLSGTSSCDAQCKSAGLTCDSGGGYVTFSRPDGTTCGRAVACSDEVSPTSQCNQKASVSASLACTCR